MRRSKPRSFQILLSFTAVLQEFRNRFRNSLLEMMTRSVFRWSQDVNGRVIRNRHATAKMPVVEIEGAVVEGETLYGRE